MYFYKKFNTLFTQSFLTSDGECRRLRQYLHLLKVTRDKWNFKFVNIYNVDKIK